MGNVVFSSSVSQGGFVAGPHDEVDEVFRAPVLLGDEVRLFGRTNVGLEHLFTLEAPGVTHLRYYVIKEDL